MSCAPVASSMVDLVEDFTHHCFDAVFSSFLSMGTRYDDDDDDDDDGAKDPVIAHGK
jgi:hypothetical protein